jgi:hypothetical protein
MKKTIKLYRPVGKRELELIAESGFTVSFRAITCLVTFSIDVGVIREFC